MEKRCPSRTRRDRRKPIVQLSRRCAEHKIQPITRSIKSGRLEWILAQQCGHVWQAYGSGNNWQVRWRSCCPCSSSSEGACLRLSCIWTSHLEVASLLGNAMSHLNFHMPLIILVLLQFLKDVYSLLHVFDSRQQRISVSHEFHFEDFFTCFSKLCSRGRTTSRKPYNKTSLQGQPKHMEHNGNHHH